MTIDRPRTMQDIVVAEIKAVEAQRNQSFSADKVEFAAWATGMLYSPQNMPDLRVPADRRVAAVYALHEALIYPFGHGLNNTDKSILKAAAERLIKALHGRKELIGDFFERRRFNSVSREIYQIIA